MGKYVGYSFGIFFFLLGDASAIIVAKNLPTDWPISLPIWLYRSIGCFAGIGVAIELMRALEIIHDRKSSSEK